MKIATLTLVLLAHLLTTASVSAGAMTNSVQITTNLLFYLVSPRSDSNGPLSRINSDHTIAYMLLGTSTNDIYYRHFPSGNFEFHLFDIDGNEVLKTKQGLDLSDMPHRPTRSELVKRSFLPESVDDGGGECRSLFTPDAIFNITKNGIYELEVRMRLCVLMTNGLPDLKAMLDGRNIWPSGWPFAKDFGILVSPPLRIQVNKLTDPGPASPTVNTNLVLPYFRNRVQP